MSRPSFIPARVWMRLLANGHRAATSADTDSPPIVKLFTPDANATWLLTEVDPSNQTVAFGLCDLGLGYPELGYVSLTELAALRGKLGLPIELDGSFVATEPLSVYAETAREAGRIVTPPHRSQSPP